MASTLVASCVNLPRSYGVEGRIFHAWAAHGNHGMFSTSIIKCAKELAHRTTQQRSPGGDSSEKGPSETVTWRAFGGSQAFLRQATPGETSLRIQHTVNTVNTHQHDFQKESLKRGSQATPKQNGGRNAPCPCLFCLDLYDVDDLGRYFESGPMVQPGVHQNYSQRKRTHTKLAKDYTRYGQVEASMWRMPSLTRTAPVCCHRVL